jgi:MtN3 and saliva related transmembrane protein
MSATDFVGYLAAIISTASFVPQVWKTLKTRDTASISLVMYLLFVVGVSGWLVWGLMAQQWPAVAANIVTLALAIVVLSFKLHAVIVKKENA